MNKSGFSILVTIIVVVLCAALGVIGISMLVTETRMSVDTMTSDQAFYIAEGGLQYYLEQLQNLATAWTTPPTKPSGKALGKGTFTITTASELADSITVISTASVTGMDDGTTIRSISENVARGGGVPMAYDYVLYASTITLSSPSPKITGTQYPGATIFPTVDFPYYQGIAAYNLPGGSSLSGTYTGNVYVSGNVTIGANNVIINGALIATGSITCASRTGFTINPTASYPAMVANGDINFTNMAGTYTINGLVYAGADGSGSASFVNKGSGSRKCYITGTIMAPGTINLDRNGGTLNVIYNSAIKTSPPPGISGSGTGITVSNWKEV